jgi:hypothetical protein
MEEYPAIVESSEKEKKNKIKKKKIKNKRKKKKIKCTLGRNHLQNLKYEVNKTLTEAQCRRKEEGVRIRTGHESRLHALTAIA